MTRLIIVTGAGRSGTSAVARVLHESGVRMGTQMAEASEANPEGFYEDVAVVELNERILSDVGLNNPWRPERWPSRAAVRTAGARLRDDMSALTRAGVEGWKDPRFAITLEAWLPTFPMSPRVVVCLRSPRAYADSVARIYGLVKPARAMREWARHYRRLLAVIRRHNIEATCVEYDALIEQPREMVLALSSFVGKSLDPSLVVPRLRRESGDIPLALQALYEEVAALHSGPPYRTRLGQTTPRRVPSPTPNYEQRAAAIAATHLNARTVWQKAGVMPRLGLSYRVRNACARYNTTLSSLQEQIDGLVPPARLAREHRRVVRRINLDRMIAQLAASAASTGDSAVRDAAIRAWKEYGRVAH